MQKRNFKIGLLTTCRSDWGLLSNLAQYIDSDPNTDLCLFVTGSHLAPSFGMTIKEINLPIAERFDILLDSDSDLAIAATASNAVDMCARALARQNPDVFIVLGDRSETLACCLAARMMRVPIAHISGGEVTEGSLDDSWRHCISQLASIHFVYCDEYRQRVIQLGNHPDTVHNVGFIALDGLEKRKWLGRRYGQFIVAWHPNTLVDPAIQLADVIELLNRLSSRDEIMYFCSANADSGGRMINREFRRFCEIHNNAHFLDMNREQFLERCRNADALIGNSSSAVYEMPAIGVPSILIGDRQDGRLLADSIITCKLSQLNTAIEVSFSRRFQQLLKNGYPLKYEGKGASKMILSVIKDFLKGGMLKVRKEFYDYGNN